MNKKIVSHVLIDSTVEIVSMAINGLMNTGDINDIKYDYSFNIKNDNIMAISPEKDVLRIFYEYVDEMHFHLTETEPGMVKLDYCIIGKKRNERLKKLIIVLFILLCVLLGFMAKLGEFSLIILFSMILMILPTFTILLAVATVGYKSKNIDKNFRNVFLPRLDKYIKIVEEHKSNKNNYYNSGFY